MAFIFHYNPKAETVKSFIAIEYNGVVCGYSEIEFSDTIIDNKNYKFLNQETFANFHALGREINQHQKFDYIIDLKSGSFTYHKSYFKQGEMEMGGTFYIENDNLKTTSLNEPENISSIPAGTILPNTQVFTYLKNDFVDKKLNTKNTMFMIFVQEKSKKLNTLC